MSFALILALAQSGLQRELRLAPGAILFRVESGEMLTDDLVCGISLDALRARVPVGDGALGVEHIDGVILHAFDKHPEALLAIEKGLFLLTLGGDVARDLGKADVRAVGVVNGVEHGIRPETCAVLANSPAFGFEPPFCGSDAQCPLRKSGVLVRGREEHGE
jgi:hypothetical protein